MCTTRARAPPFRSAGFGGITHATPPCIYNTMGSHMTMSRALRQAILPKNYDEVCGRLLQLHTFDEINDMICRYYGPRSV